MTTRTIDSAGIAFFNSEGQVLLVHQTYGKRKWALPGGQQNEGESIWGTAIRECREEIGVEVTPDEITLTGIYYLSHRNGYVYLFKVMNWSGTAKPDGVEIGEAAWVHLGELPAPMSNFTIQRIRDAAAYEGRVFLREQHVDHYVIG